MFGHVQQRGKFKDFHPWDLESVQVEVRLKDGDLIVRDCQYQSLHGHFLNTPAAGGRRTPTLIQKQVDGAANPMHSNDTTFLYCLKSMDKWSIRQLASVSAQTPTHLTRWGKQRLQRITSDRSRGFSDIEGQMGPFLRSWQAKLNIWHSRDKNWCLVPKLKCSGAWDCWFNSPQTLSSPPCLNRNWQTKVLDNTFEWKKVKEK